MDSPSPLESTSGKSYDTKEAVHLVPQFFYYRFNPEKLPLSSKLNMRTVSGSTPSAVGQTADGNNDYTSHAVALSAGVASLRQDIFGFRAPTARRRDRVKITSLVAPGFGSRAVFRCSVLATPVG